MNAIEKIMQIIAPHTCIGCKKEGAVLCSECAESMSLLPSICYACGRATKNNYPCKDHMHLRTGPNAVYIVAEYKELAKDVLLAYKFQYKREVAQQIAQLLHAVLPYFQETPLLVYVPANGAHIRKRGFDHVRLIVREIAKIRGWYYYNSIIKTRNITQVGANRQERLQHLRGAYAVHNPRSLKNQHILLVDDVITTGATIDECTRVLKKAGAKYVTALALARTPG